MKAAAWAEHELGRAELGDARRTRRLVALATVMGDGRARRCGDVRGVGWPEGRVSVLLECGGPPRVDPGESCGGDGGADGGGAGGAGGAGYDDAERQPPPRNDRLGALDTPRQRGLLLHTTLTLTPDRVPPGIVAQEVWARDPAAVGKRATRTQRPLSEQERQKWLTSLDAVIRAKAACPATRIVRLGDREADVYDLCLVGRPVGVELLVRAARDRAVDREQPHPWEALADAPTLATQSVEVPVAPACRPAPPGSPSGPGRPPCTRPRRSTPTASTPRPAPSSADPRQIRSVARRPRHSCQGVRFGSTTDIVLTLS